MKPGHHTLAAAEAQRAAYLALEAPRDQPPALAGLLVGDEFGQVVCDRTLMPAAAEKNLACDPFDKFALQLVARCRAEQRLLIAFESRSLELIRTHAGLDVSDLFADGASLASQWLSDFHPDFVRRTGLLEEILPLVGYGRPGRLGLQKSARRLRAVRNMMARKGSYESLTATVKGQWTRLLQHNQLRCAGLRAIAIAATSGPTSMGRVK